MHIHTADKWVLCNNQKPFDSFVLLGKSYNCDNVPEEKSETPLSGCWLKALTGDMR